MDNHSSWTLTDRVHAKGKTTAQLSINARRPRGNLGRDLALVVPYHGSRRTDADTILTHGTPKAPFPVEAGGSRGHGSRDLALAIDGLLARETLAYAIDTHTISPTCDGRIAG